jgi:hypothetical protein
MNSDGRTGPSSQFHRIDPLFRTGTLAEKQPPKKQGPRG